MKFSTMSVVLVFVSSFAMASEKSIECSASGRSLSRSGQAPIVAEATLKFVDVTNAESPRVLKNIEGSIKANNFEDSKVIEEGQAYIGNFKIASLEENAKYRPTKYKGYSQFQKFDATDTKGSSEDGMWGQLLLEKNTSQETFKAEYVFQAGDHMGGTLHMSCKVARAAAAKAGTYADLEKDAKQAAWVITNDGCTFSAKSDAEGLILSVKSEMGEVTEVRVPANSDVSIHQKDDTDGSFVKTYTVAGVAKLVITHADDAFDNVDLTNVKTGKTESCQVEY